MNFILTRRNSYLSHLSKDTCTEDKVLLCSSSVVGAVVLSTSLLVVQVSVCTHSVLYNSVLQKLVPRVISLVLLPHIGGVLTSYVYGLSSQEIRKSHWALILDNQGSIHQLLHTYFHYPRLTWTLVSFPSDETHFSKALSLPHK